MYVWYVYVGVWYVYVICSVFVVCDICGHMCVCVYMCVCVFSFLETGFLYVALAVLELIL